MRRRDLILLGVLVLLGGVALLDAFRDGDGRSVVNPEPLPPPSQTPTTPQAQREAPENYPRGVLRGLLVVGDADDCRIRVLDLAGGRERPVNRRRSSCELWPAPGGGLLAFGLDEERFALTDLTQSLSRGDLGTFSERSGPVLWSPDASRVAWCAEQRSGFELRITVLRPRTLDRCPSTYAGTGEPAFAVGNRLVVEGRIVLRASGPIRHAAWGNDGSVAVVVEGRPNRLERWLDNRRSDAVAIPDRLAWQPPIFAPDNCAALFADVDRAWFEVIGLDCFEVERPDLLIFGNTTSVAWSLDGQWIAAAYSDRIGFHRAATGEEEFSWPVRAAAIAWTAD
jgi:hypothetical protein